MSLSKQSSTENGIDLLEEGLRDMPVNMRIFSLSMRSLYYEHAVGGSHSTAVKFRKLRDTTRDDAMIYLKGVLPVATKFVTSITDYFGNYKALTYEEWCEELPDILQEIQSYRALCSTLIDMHEQILKSLKERESEAKVIVAQFEDLQKQLDEKKREFEKSADNKWAWAVALLLVPPVGIIAAPILASAARSDTALAIAKGAESKIQESAALTVNNCLIPALHYFISGLHAAAGFFSVMENVLSSLQSKAQANLDEKKRRHYKLMSTKVETIDKLCRDFYAILPAVRTDFHAIPTIGTDQSYVDRWLEEQKKIIRIRVSTKLFEYVMKAITTGPDFGSPYMSK